MPAANHDFTKTEIKAGALVLSGLLVLVLFGAAIRGCRPSGDATKRYITAFPNIAGLNVGADVRFGGLKAGKVVLITSDPEDRSRIRVELEVGEQFPVNEGSLASVDQVSLTAEKHLEISTGGADRPLLESGGFLEANPTTGGLFELPDVAGVIQRIETTLDGVIALIGVERARLGAGDGDPEIVDATKIMTALEAALSASGDTARTVDATLNENRETIQDVLTGLSDLETRANDLLEQITLVVDENRAPLLSATSNLDKLSKELNSEVESLATSLKVSLTHLEGLSGNSNDLLEQERVTIEQILINLQETARNLKDLSRTLADRPEALLRGKGRQGRVHKEGP